MKTLDWAPALEYLTAKSGSFKGHGTNFEGLPYVANLELRSRIDGEVIELNFRAEDEEQAFHEECTWISNDLLHQKLSLWTVSTNAPGVLQHLIANDTKDVGVERKLIFQLGTPDDLRTFRQEIQLIFLNHDEIEYRYSWGIPHEAMASKTRAILTRVDR